jgi:CBS domain-containing protein
MPSPINELAAVFAGHEPFRSLDPGARAAAVASAAVYDYPADDAILVEDGPPAQSLWIVLSGTVALLHEGQAIGVLGSGECFGHPSLLSGMAPGFTVRTRGIVRCAVMPRAAAEAVLATAAGSAYVATTMRWRLALQTHTVRGLPDVGTTPVSAIMGPPVFLARSSTVREAIRRLSDREVVAVLIRDAEATDTTGTTDTTGSTGTTGTTGTTSLAMITDAEIRAALDGGTLDLDAPVSTVWRHPAPAVPLRRLAVEAAVEMLAAHSDCVAVTDDDRVVGVLSTADLAGLDARSPIALRHTLLGSADEAGLERAAALIPPLFVLLHDAGLSPRDIGRVLSLQHDAIVSRLIDFSMSRHGRLAVADEAEVLWAWLDVGSTARREFTLASDQDNALAYGEPPPGQGPAVDAYFERLGREVGAGLVRCGIGADDNGVLAGARAWRMSKAHWIQTFDDCLTIPDESHLLRATVAFDFRSAAGSLSVTAELSERVREARQHPMFLRRMAHLGSSFAVALNRRGQLQTGRRGDPAGTLDLKRGAIVPLVNLVRYHALASAVTISPTLDRIEAAASLGELDRDSAESLREAFNVICAVRFRHHAQQISAGSAPDNLIAPDGLGPVLRADLTVALKSVRQAQRRLANLMAVGR